MQKKGIERFVSLRMLSGLSVWILTLIVLLIPASLLANKTGISESSIGYACSVVSFVSSAVYASFVCRKMQKGKIYASILCGLILTVSSLTLGYLISSSSIDSGCVLSAASFNFTGCITGGITDIRSLFTGKRGKIKISS